MKFAVVFLIAFLALTSGQNDIQQCGIEQAEIQQLKMENQQLRSNNQALAAAGGMSAVNMMVGFLSGYAGSQSNRNSYQDDEELKQTVQALAQRVEDLERQMSQPQGGWVIPSWANPEFTTNATIEQQQIGGFCRGNICYFLTVELPLASNADDACKAINTGATLAEIKTFEEEIAVIDNFKSELIVAEGLTHESFHIGGAYNVTSRIVTWRNNEEIGYGAFGWLDPIYEAAYPRATDGHTSMYLRIYTGTSTSRSYNGIFNFPPNYRYRAICRYLLKD